jgi:hypothetical protein
MYLDIFYCIVMNCSTSVLETVLLARVNHFVLTQTKFKKKCHNSIRRISMYYQLEFVFL